MSVTATRADAGDSPPSLILSLSKDPLLQNLDNAGVLR
jgi:hypothetical protein